jgi:hypothetical protein
MIFQLAKEINIMNRKVTRTIKKILASITQYLRIYDIRSIGRARYEGKII